MPYNVPSFLKRDGNALLFNEDELILLIHSK